MGTFILFMTFLIVSYGVLLIIRFFSWLAQLNLTRVYNKYKKMRGYGTGEGLAKSVIENENLRKVRVRPINGFLTDNYHRKVISLSDGVYYGNTLSAVAIAAHECGHALQQKDGYLAFYIRRGLVPLANIGSRVGSAFLVIALMIGAPDEYIIGGIMLLSAFFVYQLFTFVVEINATRRGLKILKYYGVVKTEKEMKAARSLLVTAAFTYAVQLIYSAACLMRTGGLILIGAAGKNTYTKAI